MDAIASIWQGLDWSVLTDILLSVLPSLLCITLHELCHGLVALRLGDTTARDAGRLTLNPLRHVDVMGLLMMAVFKFGWAKPVPVDMRRFKNPKRDMALTALAGPVCNLLLGLLFLFLYGLLYLPLRDSGVGGYLLQMVYLTAYISLALALFNVIPIPPLDGSKVLFSLLPDRTYLTLLRYERYGMLLLLGLAVTGVLGRTLGAVVSRVFSSLFFVAEAGFDIVRGLY